MYALKGFVTHELFINNNPSVLASFGELSTQALTYAKEKGYYNSPTYPQITLVSFTSKEDGAAIKVPTDRADVVLQIANFIYQKTLSSSNVYTTDELAIELISTFASAANTFEVGTIVTEGNYIMPESVSFKLAGLDDSLVKLWFVDQAFRNQYDQYEIVIVPPMDNLDDFFRFGNEVRGLLTLRTYPEEMEKIQIAKDGHPETIIRAELYDYVDPMNTTLRTPSKWSLLIYGAGGDNIDTIKDALVEYILANSSHTRDEWKAILPDIFLRTEFILIPFWTQYAIPNRTLQAGIYSPVANPTAALAYLKSVIPSYSTAHIDAHASVMGHPYKSLVLGAIGSAENRDGKYKITDEFPDYLNISSTSLDFNRMTEHTKNWLLTLAEMILVTESMGEFTDIPVGMSRVYRDGILYLVKNYKNIHYLVAGKANFPTP